jgi:5-methyltetrahydropteroyltriglutamate--homocysteine methyltransferase
MKRSAERILTTHTGSLPRTAKVVELLLAEQHSRGARKAELAAAVGEAIAYVVGKQIECGIDIVNDGEQGRTDYTVHVLDRLAGFAGESTPPLGTGDPEFPELAQLLTHFASPFQYRPACTGEVTWKDWAAAQADIDLSKNAMSGVNAAEFFMTSPSPGQIARYLKNKHYKSEEAYVYALADVMKREYQAIVDAGFILQLDCPDLAMLRHTVYLDKSLADFRKIIAVNVAALNHAVADIPADRMRMHVCWGSTVAPHHTDVPLIDIIDVVLSAKPMAVSFPAANGMSRARMEDLAAGETARRKGDRAGRHRFDGEHRGASGSRRRPHREFCQPGRARERHRRRRLRLRNLCGPCSGRQQDRLAQTAIARRRRPPRVGAAMGDGGVTAGAAARAAIPFRA